MSSTDTIFALATPPARSGVAILRLSGPQAFPALQCLTGLEAPAPRLAHYAVFRSPHTREIIDRGLALVFPAPRSFTGEDVAELHIHGSLAVIRELLGILATLPGLRPAEPGEFSRRAFINGKMDLIEAEGLADLIAAETPQQKKQALRQMGGELSRHYEQMRSQIIHCLAYLEAYIDFPDEDIPQSVLTALNTGIAALQATIGEALADHKRGERLRDGISIVILGAPNAGKSSLLNAIARREAAIVSHTAGTTRDLIEVHMDMAGFPVVLVDTAGLRESHDAIEAEGIRRALARADAADIKLVLFDGERWPDADPQGRALLDGQSLAAVTKCDLSSSRNRGDLPVEPLFISTKTGEGVDALLQLVEQCIGAFFSGQGAPLITRSRHRALLENALECLDKSRLLQPLELQCEELRLAARALGKITGKIQVDDVLDVVFTSFCIGK